MQNEPKIPLTLNAFTQKSTRRRSISQSINLRSQWLRNKSSRFKTSKVTLRTLWHQRRLRKNKRKTTFSFATCKWLTASLLKPSYLEKKSAKKHKNDQRLLLCRESLPLNRHFFAKWARKKKRSVSTHSRSRQRQHWLGSWRQALRDASRKP